ATSMTKDDTIYMTVEPKDVGTWLSIRTRLGNGSCIVNAMDVGTMCEDKVTYECPKIDGSSDPEDVDCWCKGISVVLTYGRCKTNSTTPAPQRRRSRR
nr:protein pr [Donggang virus]